MNYYYFITFPLLYITIYMTCISRTHPSVFLQDVFFFLVGRISIITGSNSFTNVSFGCVLPGPWAGFNRLLLTPPFSNSFAKLLAVIFHRDQQRPRKSRLRVVRALNYRETTITPPRQTRERDPYLDSSLTAGRLFKSLLN